MQLATLEKLSMMTMDLKQMQFNAEMSLKQAYLDLKFKMLDAQVQLSKAQQNFELVKAGLSDGSTPVETKLTLDGTGVAQSNPSSGDGVLTPTGNGDGDQNAIAAISESPAGKLLNSLGNTTSKAVASTSDSVAASVSEPPSSTPKPARAIAGAPRPIRTINAYSGEGSSADEATSSGEAIAVPFQYTE
jgi:hypothetical protein